nr:DUF2271 domain-containing protein [Novipirellula galeiformis]
MLAYCSCATTQAEQLSVSVEIPQLNVSEYHRPYVAIWIEEPSSKTVRDLSVWYQMRQGKEGHGTKWLPDLRQWWRRSGRYLEMPVDGVTSATRPVGKHVLEFSHEQAPLKDLPAGSYTLVVEAVREVGGRELVKIPFQWPVDAPQTKDAKGDSELGGVSLTLKP